MIDQAGPWGTGAFTLVEGYSSLRNHLAVISTDPFAATWLDVEQPRTDRVVLEANPGYWDVERGPRLSRVVYRNELSPSDALDLVCDRDGEVDIVSEVAPGDAARVEQSQHAHLVSHDAMRVLVGMINRDAADVPLGDVRARRALNFAVDRARLVAEAFHGHAHPLSGFTPHFATGIPEGMRPYPHEPERARSLLAEAGWPEGRSLRLAAPPDLADLAHFLAPDFEQSLGVKVEVVVPAAGDVPGEVRKIVEKKLPLGWDLLLHAWIDLSADAPPAMLHREFIGSTGAFRTGPVIDQFDELFNRFSRTIDPQRLTQLAEEIDRFCYDEALAVFLCSPTALYAVNNHVTFRASATTFELAETEVDEQHWSRRG